MPSSSANLATQATETSRLAVETVRRSALAKVALLLEAENGIELTSFLIVLALPFGRIY